MKVFISYTGPRTEKSRENGVKEREKGERQERGKGERRERKRQRREKKGKREGEKEKETSHTAWIACNIVP
jgi:hypothetical protein